MKVLLLVPLFVFIALSGSLAQKQKPENLLKQSSIEFVENRGQFVSKDGKFSDVLYLANVGGKKIYVRHSGISYVLSELRVKSDESGVGKSVPKSTNDNSQLLTLNSELSTQNSKLITSRIDMDLVGMNPDARIKPQEKLDCYNNYYLAHCPDGITHVPVYRKIVYENAYDNIDLVLYENKGDAEYDFVIKPGADLSQIKLDIKAADKVSVDKAGNLVIETASGRIEHLKPFSFQLIKGIKKEIKSSFKIDKNGIISFEAKGYDKRKELIIDPLVRLWGTYLGGEERELANDLVVDNNQNVYIIGTTGSGSGISTPGAHDEYLDSTNSLTEDGYIMKFNSSGQRVWGTYYGGAAGEKLSSIDLYKGFVFISGNTASRTAIATSGTYQPTKDTDLNEAFIAKFDTNGIRIWGTYYGGNEIATSDNFHSCHLPLLKCDKSGNAYFGSMTNYRTGMATPGSFKYRMADNDYYDICLAKFDSTGNIVWGTYFGGPNLEEFFGIDIDNSGNVLIAGYTQSTSEIASPGAYQTTPASSFIGKFDTLGNRVWSTYVIVPNGNLEVHSIIHDSANNIYFSGWVDSSAARISTPGAYNDKWCGGSHDDFLAKYDSNGRKKWVTYVGGEADEYSAGYSNKVLTFINSTHLCLTGGTNSRTNIATKNGYISQLPGNFCSFINIFHINGRKRYGTYYGGDDTREATIFANNNYIYLLGETSSDSGIATPGTHRSTHNQTYGTDGFLVRFAYSPDSPVSDFLSFDADITGCIGNAAETDSSFVIENYGNVPFKVRFDQARFSQNTPGLTLVSPKDSCTLEPNSFKVVKIRYTFQKNTRGIIYDTLLIPHTSGDTSMNPWKVFIKINIKNYKLLVYDEKLTTALDTLYMGTTCPKETINKIINIKNISPFGVTVICKFKNAGIFNVNGKNSDTIPENSAKPFNIGFIPPTGGKFSEWLYLYIRECPGFIDSILVTGDAIPAKGLKFYDANLTKELDTLNMGIICVGSTITKTFNIKNISSMALTSTCLFKNRDDFTLLGNTLYLIAPNAAKPINIRFTPLATGKFSEWLYTRVQECPGYVDSILVVGEGIETKLAFEGNSDFGIIKSGEADTLEIILKNRGPGGAYIDDLINLNPPFRIINIIPQLPKFLQPGELIRFYIEYKPVMEGQDSCLFAAFSTFTNEYKTISCLDTAWIKLTGKCTSSNIGINKSKIDFGIIADCQTQTDTIIVTNKGNTIITINEKAIIKGINSSNFSIANQPNVPLTLKKEEKAFYIIEFNPQKNDTGSKYAELIIKTNDSKYPEIRIPVFGIVEKPELEINPPDIDFGNIIVSGNGSDKITITNKSNLDIEIKEISCDNPDIKMQPTPYLLNKKESKDISIDWQPKNSGKMSTVIRIIIDKPCPDTIVIRTKGMAIEGKLAINSSLDYGTTAFCEEKTDSVVITNTGDTPVEIKEMTIGGTDASFFSFSDNITLPDTLVKDEKLVRIAKYNGSASTDGIKIASITTKAVVDGTEKIYTTDLKAERVPIIITSNPASLNFPDTKPGDSQIININVKNESRLPVIIENIQVKVYPSAYTINPTTLALNPKEEKPVDVTFNPVAEGDFADSLIFKCKMAGCEGEKALAIKAKCKKDIDTITHPVEYINATAWLPDTSAWINNEAFGIPLMLRLEKDTTIKDLSYTAKIQFEAAFYAPDSVLNAGLVDNRIYSATRNVEIKGMKTITSTRDTILSTMVGKVYMGNGDYTDMVLGEIILSDTTIKVTKVNGKLRIRGICKPNLSRIELYEGLSISITPLPANEEAEIKVQGKSEGEVKLNIYSIEGVKKEEILLNKSCFELSEKLNLKEYPEGIYQVVVQSQDQMKNLPMVVVK